MCGDGGLSVAAGGHGREKDNGVRENGEKSSDKMVAPPLRCFRGAYRGSAAAPAHTHPSSKAANSQSSTVRYVPIGRRLEVAADGPWDPNAPIHNAPKVADFLLDVAFCARGAAPRPSFQTISCHCICNGKNWLRPSGASP